MRAAPGCAATALLSIVCGGCGADARPQPPAQVTVVTDSFDDRRARMVESQILARGVTAPAVLDAMRAVPRHRFVSADLQALAYADQPLPIGHGQTISQPYIVAYMTEVLDASRAHRVLEIGTGCGYQAAVLAHVARQVDSIEIIPELAEGARKLLGELGYKNVQVRTGDGYAGWPERAPYDRILVTAAPDHVPQPLVDQLAVGGRMVLPVGRANQDIVIVEKTERGVVERKTIAVRFVPLVRGQQ